MKILICYPNFKNRFGANNMYYFLEELARQADCEFVGYGYPDASLIDKPDGGKKWDTSGPLWTEAVEEFKALHHDPLAWPNRYQAPTPRRKQILLYDLKKLYGKENPDWVWGTRIVSKEINRDYKLCNWVGDVHVSPDIQIRTANEEFDLILIRCLHSKYVFNTVDDFRAVFGVRPYTKWIKDGHMLEVPDDWYINQLTTNYMFWPPTVPPIIKPIPESEKKYDVTMIATVGGFYPIRESIEKNLPKLAKELGRTALLRRPPNMKNVVHRQHMDRAMRDPGLRKKWFLGEEYARALAESKIFIFGSSIFNYSLAKYFEAMGAGALVMANKPFHAEELHFKPGWNFVEINADNWQEKLMYMLDDDQLRETIARRGYETVMKYHTNEVRVAETLKVMKAID